MNNYAITKMAANYIFDYMWDDIKLNKTSEGVDYYIEKLNLNCIEDDIEIFELLHNYSLLNIKDYTKGTTINFKKLQGDLMKYFWFLISADYITVFVESFEKTLSKYD